MRDRVDLARHGASRDDAVPRKGTLSEISLPALLRRPVRARKTGVLRVDARQP